MSETKAAFAEGTIRSLKNILYRYIEDYGYKYIHKVSPFVTTLNSRKNCSIDQKMSRIPTFCPISTAIHDENIKNPILRLGKDFASPSMTYPSGTVISLSLHKRFSKLLQFLAENLQHTRIKRTRLSVVFYQKELIKVI